MSPRSRFFTAGAFVAGVAWMSVTVASCGDMEVLAAGSSTCKSLYGEVCGKPCTTDADCSLGLFCGPEGVCDAECHTTQLPCPQGEGCTEAGQCVGLGAGGGGGSGAGLTVGAGGTASNASGGAPGVGGSCGDVEVTFEPQIPTVVLLIDQSGSMTADFNGQPRWDAVYDALMDPNGGVVKTLEPIVRFGLALYTYTSGPTCPEIVEVTPPALNAHATIDAVFAPAVPLSNTPTGDSITAITPGLVAFAERGPKLIVLATDGDPDRCEDPNGHDQVSKDESTAAAQAAFAQGIEMVIIAVGDQVSDVHQQDMANAGKGLPVPAANPCDQVADPMNCAKTYEPATKQELVDAFNEIILGQRECVFTLNGQVIPGKECQGTVIINNNPIPCNDPNGWQLNSPSEIEFVGTACDTIMNDPNVMITASFPCDAIETGSGPPR